LGPQTHFWAGRHENKEKRLLYFGLTILLPIQIQLLDIENPKKSKNLQTKLYPNIFYIISKNKLKYVGTAKPFLSSSNVL
jgi:hypothetical protein